MFCNCCDKVCNSPECWEDCGVVCELWEAGRNSLNNENIKTLCTLCFFSPLVQSIFFRENILKDFTVYILIMGNNVSAEEDIKHLNGGFNYQVIICLSLAWYWSDSFIYLVPLYLGLSPGRHVQQTVQRGRARLRAALHGVPQGGDGGKGML